MFIFCLFLDCLDFSATNNLSKHKLPLHTFLLLTLSKWQSNHFACWYVNAVLHFTPLDFQVHLILKRQNSRIRTQSTATSLHWFNFWQNSNRMHHLKEREFEHFKYYCAQCKIWYRYKVRSREYRKCENCGQFLLIKRWVLHSIECFKKRISWKLRILSNSSLVIKK